MFFGHPPRPRTRRRQRSRSLNAEWVEIANTTRHAVNLDGWTLRDSDVSRYRFDAASGRARVRIHTGESRDTCTDLCQDRRNYAWPEIISVTRSAGPQTGQPVIGVRGRPRRRGRRRRRPPYR